MSFLYRDQRNSGKTWRTWLPFLTLALIVVLELVGCIVIYFARG